MLSGVAVMTRAITLYAIAAAATARINFGCLIISGRERFASVEAENSIVVFC